MGQSSVLEKDVVDPVATPASEPTLLVELEPRSRAFFGNLRDLIWPRQQPPLRLISWPAAPSPNIFVERPLPWKGLSESVVLHLALVAGLLWLTPLLSRRTLVVEKPVFQHEDVIYYSPSEYLPPIDTGNTHVAQAVKGEPEFAPQPIISVPPEADNRKQTIVTPPNVKLDHDVPLPNMVAWSAPAPVAVPMAATARTSMDWRVPSLTTSAIAPPPEISKTMENRMQSLSQTAVAPPPAVKLASQRQVLQPPEASVVAPPPSMNSMSTRRLSDINIGPSEAVAPAPKLPMGAQRSLASMAPTGVGSAGPDVALPPPSMQGAGTSGSGGGRIIALSVRPAPPSASVEVPAGNRRGTFAATPEGKVGAAGTPDSPAGKENSSPTGGTNGQSGNGAGSGQNMNGAPAGIHIGAGPKNGPTSAIAGSGESESGNDPALVAKIVPPKGSSIPARAASEVPSTNASEVDKRVFGSRKFYSMTLNMPNLNSAGGSWVIRFAELDQTEEKGELTAPVATRKVDPAYPIELMRRNLQGTVMLRAIIHSDGTVGDVRVVQGVNDRLDEYAKSALLHWHFQPGTKNGNAVDLEAEVRIPFKAFSKGSIF